MKKQKSIFLIVAILIFVAVAVVVSVTRTNKKNADLKNSPVSVAKPTPTRTVSPFVNAKEPKIELKLQSDRTRGTLAIGDIDSIFTTLEYEFIYQSDYKGSLVERGISSGGSVPIPAGRKLIKDLTFGVESCTTGKCHFIGEVVEVDQPATLIIRLLNNMGEVWEQEKKVSFGQEGKGYEAIFKE